LYFRGKIHRHLFHSINICPLLPFSSLVRKRILARHSSFSYPVFTYVVLIRKYRHTQPNLFSTIVPHLACIFWYK
jgi:hypothetical protein